MDYNSVIGLEVHSQLLTDSKMFCNCKANYQDSSPNTTVCEVCMGMPGVLPVVNRKAIEFVIATGLALGCTIAESTKFDRKNYPYPDLMKGYQISQYDQPIASEGCLTIDIDGKMKNVGITRVHLEEDVAKLIHRTTSDGESYSLLDVNRAGVALMEIVSEPDMETPEEARLYLTKIHSILRYIGVSTANMEEGSFRCDANISIRPSGSTELGPKVEVKNMNSFRSVYSALEYEIDRQKRLVNDGQRIIQETRGWVDDREVTVSQRTKEYASDYRYFPEPDIPPLSIKLSLVNHVKSSLPELPHAKEARFVEEYGLSAYDSRLLTSSKPEADFFESIMSVRNLTDKAKKQFAKSVSNWMLGELARLVNATNTTVSDFCFKPEHIAELIDLVDSKTLNLGMAKVVFEQMFHTGDNPAKIAEGQGMMQITDVEVVQIAVDEAIDTNSDAVNDYLTGKGSALGFLVGQVMKITKGNADPKLAAKQLKDKLDSIGK